MASNVVGSGFAAERDLIGRRPLISYFVIAFALRACRGGQ